MNLDETSNQIRLYGIDSAHEVTQTLRILLTDATPETVRKLTATIYNDVSIPMHRTIASKLEAMSEEKEKSCLTLGPK